MISARPATLAAGAALALGALVLASATLASLQDFPRGLDVLGVHLQEE